MRYFARKVYGSAPPERLTFSDRVLDQQGRRYRDARRWGYATLCVLVVAITLIVVLFEGPLF